LSSHDSPPIGLYACIILRLFSVYLADARSQRRRIGGAACTQFQRMVATTWRSDRRSTLATSLPATAPASTSRDPRVVVVAKPAGGPLADRARLRPILARVRVRRAEIPAV